MDSSLFIGFVAANVTVSKLERLFEDTFNAKVVVHFSNQRKNQYGTWFKSASVKVCSSSSSLNHFLSQVTLHGNNTFTGDGNSYKVQFSQEVPVKRVSPRIM
jgi:hypothetical protein